jgi:hypothetical protein
MNNAECSLGLANCEPVTSWPTGWQIVAILAVFVGGIWALRRGR